MTTKQVLLLVLLCCSAGCSSILIFPFTPKDKYNGENGEYFITKINESEWYPVQRTAFYGSDSPVHLYYHKHSPGDPNIYTFSLEVTRDDDPYSLVSITVDSIKGIGTYFLSDSSKGAWASYRLHDSARNHNFMTSDVKSGTLELTNIDTARRIITGKVKFDATEGDSTIRLTEGEFTASYYP